MASVSIYDCMTHNGLQTGQHLSLTLVMCCPLGLLGGVHTITMYRNDFIITSVCLALPVKSTESIASQWGEKRCFDGSFCPTCMDYVNGSSLETRLRKMMRLTRLSLRPNSIGSIMFGPSWLSPLLASSWTQSAPDLWVKWMHASSTCQQLKPKLSSAISVHRSPQERGGGHLCQGGF